MTDDTTPAKRATATKKPTPLAAVPDQPAKVPASEPTPALDREQLQRVEALKEARAILRPTVLQAPLEPVHVCDVAEFILNGLHPLAIYTSPQFTTDDAGDQELTFITPQEGHHQS